ncbi:MAG: radical SAM family heme chaperone HemW [Bacteroidetes bacterium]|nr:radical SAM family heme chaperone HemW [Bacteroidota bacterium]
MAGIYIHIPFCRKRCSYCDFHFSTTFSNYREELISAINREIELRKYELKESIETIYFGGGTPSLLTEEELSSILETIRNLFPINQEVEITLEVNPEDVNLETITYWKILGVNRISIGLQSFKESDLKWMNRAHDLEQGFEAVNLLKKQGFENISVDLIYGLPGLTLLEWEQHLKQVIALNIQHISAYCLTVEKRTALNHFVKTGKLKTPSEDIQSEQFNLMLRVLNQNGFFQYEISNFAKPVYESKHNSSYWQNKPYLGVGPSAHSFDGKTRRWNISNNTNYYKNVGTNESWFEMEILSKNDQWNELFLTGLRTIFGVSKTSLSELGKLSSSEIKTMGSLKEQGELVETENAYILTEKGRLKADGIAASFFRI